MTETDTSTYTIGVHTDPFSPALVEHALVQMMIDYKRIAVIGGGGTGKTSLVRAVTAKVPEFYALHADKWQTDDLGKPLDWSLQSLGIMSEGNNVIGRAVFEGTRVVYAMRKGLKVEAVLHLKRNANPEKYPNGPTMAKQIDTVLADWRKSNPRIPVIQI